MSLPQYPVYPNPESRESRTLIEAGLLLEFLKHHFAKELGESVLIFTDYNHFDGGGYSWE